MKKRTKKKRRMQYFREGLLLASLVMVVSAAGCGRNAGRGSEPEASEETMTVSPKISEAAPEISETPEPVSEPEPAPVELTVYFGNEECDGLVSKTVTVKQMDSDVIVDELVKAQVLKENVRVNEMVQKTKKNKTILYLDFNQAFQKQLESYGSAGEQIFMGSVVNTFLDAQSADSVKITVQGKTPETGHEIYDQPLERYELASSGSIAD